MPREIRTCLFYFTLQLFYFTLLLLENIKYVVDACRFVSAVLTKSLEEASERRLVHFNLPVAASRDRNGCGPAGAAGSMITSMVSKLGPESLRALRGPL